MKFHRVFFLLTLKAKNTHGEMKFSLSAHYWILLFWQQRWEIIYKYQLVPEVKIIRNTFHSSTLWHHHKKEGEQYLQPKYIYSMGKLNIHLCCEDIYRENP